MAKAGSTARLATAWEGSDDGLTVTFKLRDGVKWHDGKPFTSADVAFSALQIWKPLQNLGRVVFKDLEAVETPDALTAVFRFAKPTPFQLIRNALPALTSVVPKHLYEGTDIAANPANNAPVGTGPFKFAEYKAGEYYRLRAQRRLLARGRAAISTRSSTGCCRTAPRRPARSRPTRSSSPPSRPCRSPISTASARSTGIEVITKGYEALTYQLVVEINHRRKELADLKVRQAIAHAIDKDFVVKTIFLGYAKPATGPVPQNDKQFYTADVPTYPFDVAKANALLDEAGYKRGGDGTRFKLKLLPAPYFNETKQFGDYLRQALAAVGIDAEIVNNDAAAHQKAVYTDHAFDLAVAPPVFRGDPAISTTILVQSGIPDGVPFSNQGGYANAELDALIAKAAETLDDGQAHRALQGFPETRRRRPAADQRRRMGLHHRGAQHR